MSNWYRRHRRIGAYLPAGILAICGSTSRCCSHYAPSHWPARSVLRRVIHLGTLETSGISHGVHAQQVDSGRLVQTGGPVFSTLSDRVRTSEPSSSRLSGLIHVGASSRRSRSNSVPRWKLWPAQKERAYRSLAPRSRRRPEWPEGARAFAALAGEQASTLQLTNDSQDSISRTDTEQNCSLKNHLQRLVINSRTERHGQP